MKRYFTEMAGYDNVHHTKTDCYAVWDEKNISSQPYPYPMDVLITNPPYSGDHIERLIQHLTQKRSLFFFHPTMNQSTNNNPMSSNCTSSGDKQQQACPKRQAEEEVVASPMGDVEKTTRTSTVVRA